MKLRLLASQDLDRIFAVDLQMSGKGDKWIKEFVVFGKCYKKHMIIESDNNPHKTANKIMVSMVHGIPLDYTNKPKIELCNVLESLCNTFTNPVVIICGHNKMMCLKKFIANNHLPSINIINIEHYIKSIREKNTALPNGKQILNGFPVWNSEENKICPIGTVSVAHIKRCSHLRVIDLYNNIVLWYKSSETEYR